MSWGMIWLVLSVYSNIAHFLQFALIVVLCGVFFAVIGSLFVCDSAFHEPIMETKEYFRMIKKWTIWSLVFIVPPLIIMPAKKDVMIAIALHAGQKPAEQVISDMGAVYPKIKTLLEKELDDLLKTEGNKNEIQK